MYVHFLFVTSFKQMALSVTPQTYNAEKKVFAPS